MDPTNRANSNTTRTICPGVVGDFFFKVYNTGIAANTATGRRVMIPDRKDLNNRSIIIFLLSQHYTRVFQVVLVDQGAHLGDPLGMIPPRRDRTQSGLQ
jgi:hypothetical protein